jgi:hypothetical protein
MKKLILSAFAVSLILMPLMAHPQPEELDDFLGLESSILPDLKGLQRFTPPTLHERESWRVNPDKVEIDLALPNKGQGFSIIPWSSQDPEDWLNINKWVMERTIKDETPDWKIRLRQLAHKELAGKILQCIGLCEVYRGSNKAKVQHLSRILEGDEIKTDKDSVAWVYLMDGSLMRLSPETSVSINEFNISKDIFFILARLNQGHLFFHPRESKEFPMEIKPETDAISLPLLVREANQQHYEREIYKNQSDEKRLLEVLSLDENAIIKQINVLNTLRSDHEKFMAMKTRIMIVTPNSSLVAKDVGLDYVYIPGGKSYFKKRTTREGEECAVYLRGYSMTQPFNISDMDWFEVYQNGRNYNPMSDVPGTLQVLELLTKRIKTIELAREVWVRDFTIPIIKARSDAALLGKNFGYTLWGDELARRFEFLIEHTRRIETTNLRSIENLLVKLEASGKKIDRELHDGPYQVSLNHYLLGLKKRYDKSKIRVRDMSDLQYYVWILKNGKF